MPSLNEEIDRDREDEMRSEGEGLPPNPQKSRDPRRWERRRPTRLVQARATAHPTREADLLNLVLVGGLSLIGLVLLTGARRRT